MNAGCIIKTAAVASMLALSPVVRAEDRAASRPAPPFAGAYIHMPMLLKRAADDAGRRRVIRDELAHFRAAGLRVLMPYVTTTSGAAMYESRIIPVREMKDCDPLALLRAEARKQGLDVWPVICVIPAGDKEPKGILKEHPEWALRDREGKPLGYVSPAHPKACEWLVSVVREIVTRYEPQGLLLDYLRYPSQVVQFDAESSARFEKESAGEADPKAAMQAFKERELTELARMISEEARRLRPAIRIGLYTWGPQVTKSHNVAQAWPIWAERGYIDLLNVSGYCYRDNYGDKYLAAFEDRMKEAASLVKKAGGRAELTFALGVRTSHGAVPDAKAIGDYLRIARGAGVKGVAFFTWSYLAPYRDEVNRAGYLKTFLD